MHEASREKAGTVLLRVLSLVTSCQPRYRASELKHGRVAMLASVGIAYTASGGPLFAGPVALDGTTFASLGSDPWTAFAALPYSGKLQMLIVIGLLEFHSEIPSGGQKHYLNGGTPGKIMVGGFPLFDPIGFMGSMSQAEKDKAREGRLLKPQCKPPAEYVVTVTRNPGQSLGLGLRMDWGTEWV